MVRRRAEGSPAPAALTLFIQLLPSLRTLSRRNDDF